MSDALKRGIDVATRNNFKDPYRDQYGMYGTEPVQEIETPELDFHTEEVPDVADVIPESEEIEDAE